MASSWTKQGFLSPSSEGPNTINSVKTTFSQCKRYLVICLLTAVVLFLSFRVLNSWDQRFDLNPNEHGHRNWGRPPPPPPHFPPHFPPPPPHHPHHPHHPPGGRKSFLADRLDFSERLYQDSVRERNEAIERMSSTESSSTVIKLWDLFTPSFACPHRVKLFGKEGDSPKWVCGFEHLQKKKCVVYSIGVSPESTFEESVLSRTSECEIFAYNLTAQSFGESSISPKDLANRVHKSQSSVGIQDEAEQNVYTLSSLMAQNGHRFVDILKFDIEEGALESLEAFFDGMDLPEDEVPPRTASRPYPPPRRPHHPPEMKKPVLPIGQLQVAVSAKGGILIEEFNTWWQKLEKTGLRPFWASPRLSANGDYLGIVDYSFLNIRGDHALVSSHRHGHPQRPHPGPFNDMFLPLPPLPPPPPFGLTGHHSNGMFERLRAWFFGPNPRPFPHHAWPYPQGHDHGRFPPPPPPPPPLHMHEHDQEGHRRPRPNGLNGEEVMDHHDEGVKFEQHSWKEEEEGHRHPHLGSLPPPSPPSSHSPAPPPFHGLPPPPAPPSFYGPPPPAPPSFYSHAPPTPPSFYGPAPPAPPSSHGPTPPAPPSFYGPHPSPPSSYGPLPPPPHFHHGPPPPPHMFPPPPPFHHGPPPPHMPFPPPPPFHHGPPPPPHMPSPPPSSHHGPLPPPALTPPSRFVRVESHILHDDSETREQNANRQPLQDQVFGEWKLFSGGSAVEDEGKGEEPLRPGDDFAGPSHQLGRPERVEQEESSRPEGQEDQERDFNSSPEHSGLRHRPEPPAGRPSRGDGIVRPVVENTEEDI